MTGLIAICALTARGVACADDLDALQLADTVPAAVETASDWRTFVEGSGGGEMRRDTNPARYNRRFSADIQYDHSFATNWRAVFADRLDIASPPQFSGQNSINTLKEAYFSWRVQPETICDLGRVNLRNGVATGYNPTDYFRAGALRSVVSIDPASLKENREGSVMLRGQRLWDGGAVSVMYSPRLSDQASNNAFNPDWGATNHQNRTLIAVSQKFNDYINPQFLIYQEGRLPPQLGFNLTALLNDATVVYAEWSGGRSASLLTEALKQVPLAIAEDRAFRNRVATGVTYTTPDKLTLTAEFEYNGGGLKEGDWNALRRGSLAAYGLYRTWVQIVQDLPTQQTLFFYGLWQDAMVNHLDVSAMESVDAADGSQRAWLEARYHLDRYEYALQWQHNSGQRLSNFGAAAQLQSWQVSLRYYF